MDKRYDFRKTEQALRQMWEEQETYRFQNGRERKSRSFRLIRLKQVRFMRVTVDAKSLFRKMRYLIPGQHHQ